MKSSSVFTAGAQGMILAASIGFWLVFSLTIGAQERTKASQVTPYPGSFENQEELKHFAASTAFGGENVSEYNVGNSRVWVVTRRFTSGFSVSDCAILTERGNKIVVSLYLPQAMRTYRSKVDGSGITIERFDAEKKQFKHFVTFEPE